MNRAVLDKDACAAVFPRVRGEAPARAAWPRLVEEVAGRVASAERPVGIIFNARAHHNLEALDALPILERPVDRTSPRTLEELHAAPARSAARGIGDLVVDGDDGTVRDIFTVSAGHFMGQTPRIALVPSSKTNGLACDLGIPQGWTLHDALAAIRRGRTRRRSPIEISRGDQLSVLHGFVFGAGAFVKRISQIGGARPPCSKTGPRDLINHALSSARK